METSQPVWLTVEGEEAETRVGMLAWSRCCLLVTTPLQKKAQWKLICPIALWGLTAPGSRPTPDIGRPYSLAYSGYFTAKGAIRTYDLWGAVSFSCLSNKPKHPSGAGPCSAKWPGQEEEGWGRGGRIHSCGSSELFSPGKQSD